MTQTAALKRHPHRPFAPPSQLPPDLAHVCEDWRGRLRGSAQIPFSDDLDLKALAEVGPRLFLVDVFARPERFRFATVGAELPADLEDRFLDEIGLGRTSLGPPFEYLRAQCAATLEAAAPTLHREGGDHPYTRLLLPFWGDGRIGLLLGIVAFDRA